MAKAAKEETTAVVKTGDKGLPADMMSFIDNMQGVEGVEFAQDEMTVPRIKLAQDLTPQVKKQNAEYIKGLESGDFFEVVTEQVWPGATGIFVIPVSYKTRYTEWVPRAKGGGLVADRSDDEGIRELWQENRKEQADGRVRCVLDNGNELARTAEYYVLVLDYELQGDKPVLNGSVQEAVLTLGGTQARKARRWNRMIQGRMLRRSNGQPFKPPMYTFIYHVKSVAERDDQNSWSGVHVSMAELPETEDGLVFRLNGGTGIFKMAEKFRELVDSGKKVADAEYEEETGSAGKVRTTDAGSAKLDDDIPF